MPLKDQKKAIRKRIKELKKAASPEELKKQSRIIQEKVMQSEHFKDSEHILLYWPLPDEVDTKEILNEFKDSKKLYLPVIKGDDLEIYLFEGDDKMVPGEKYGIPEPAGKKIEDETLIELVIVPGVAFDKENNRLGRGAGYYDRILIRLPRSRKTGLAFNFQIVDKIPAEPHDIRMDEVITA
ncbi:MAG: 5-formyltetrahydrofolate cyclo-ligase [Chlorobi bacterium]|nr:5-formyltetrahydrofolate cyclo-ligase [Chlorobiota bacterium]